VFDLGNHLPAAFLVPPGDRDRSALLSEQDGGRSPVMSATFPASRIT
jgi:hypothetical protein